MQQFHTEVHGEGPPLILIPGGGGDAGIYADAVPLLATSHTVITYDRRGNSRSPLTHPDDPVDVATQANDVITLLDRLGVSRAAVFGSSSGAIIALDLIARHSDRLTCVVVHEAPAVGVLEAGSPESAELQDMFRISQEQGVMHAFAAFGAMTMPNPPRFFRSRLGRTLIAAGSRTMLHVAGIFQVLTGKEPGTMTRMLGNADILMRQELPAFCFDYDIDVPSLQAENTVWTTAVGEDSMGRPYDRPTRVLAERAGVDCVAFPGGHTVYQEDPAAFAKRLSGLLKEFGL
jgi:pimeloyl-ACP methyl ester carboxylesterase